MKFSSNVLVVAAFSLTYINALPTTSQSPDVVEQSKPKYLAPGSIATRDETAEFDRSKGKETPDGTGQAKHTVSAGGPPIPEIVVSQSDPTYPTNPTNPSNQASQAQHSKKPPKKSGRKSKIKKSKPAQN